MLLLSRPRAETEYEKIRYLLRVVRHRERSTWMDCMRRHGITLWAA